MGGATECGSNGGRIRRATSTPAQYMASPRRGSIASKSCYKLSDKAPPQDKLSDVASPVISSSESETSETTVRDVDCPDCASDGSGHSMHSDRDSDVPTSPPPDLTLTNLSSAEGDDVNEHRSGHRAMSAPAQSRGFEFPADRRCVVLSRANSERYGTKHGRSMTCQHTAHLPQMKNPLSEALNGALDLDDGVVMKEGFMLQKGGWNMLFKRKYFQVLADQRLVYHGSCRFERSAAYESE